MSDMSTNNSEQLTIMFADIAGSTKLYDLLGDKKAYPMIKLTLDIMSKIVNNNKGRVVGTAGDEIMCQFYDANNAVESAFIIQNTLNNDINLGVRIGMHTGLTGVHNGRPFGDTVNVASRMTGLAKAGRVIISSATSDAINTVYKANLRDFDTVIVKGKSKPVQTFEYIWDQSNSTRVGGLSPITSQNIQPAQSALECQYKSLKILLTPQHPIITIGRAHTNDISISSTQVSREHATIELVGNLVIFTDHSTNGCNFKIKATDNQTHAGGLEFILHRDKWVLSGKGVIGVGEPAESSQNLIFFEHFR
ncbi:MAG: adenylate/guanylate cyclase domain-containing protein [Planctomycetes bacterium]|nr:adenylate/guanylate cyclase domain-containing protein [Planctomycetota bacterium]